MHSFGLLMSLNVCVFDKLIQVELSKTINNNDNHDRLKYKPSIIFDNDAPRRGNGTK